MTSDSFRRLDHIGKRRSAKMARGEQLTPEEEDREIREIEALGFRLARGELDGLMGVSVKVCDAFQKHVDCASASRGTYDGSRLDIRFYVPIQYQLDHSLAVKRGLEDAQAVFHSLCKGYRTKIVRRKDSILLAFIRKRK